MGIFKKASGNFPTQSKWSVHQGQNAGKPMFVRRNDSALQLSSNLDYGIRLGVAIPLLCPNDAGLPTKEESETLNQIEDELSRQFEKDQLSLLVLVITTSGMREFIFYTKGPQSCEQILPEIAASFPLYEFQTYTEEDKKWALYKQFK